MLALDQDRRKLVARVEELRAEQNRGSKLVRDATGEERQRLIESLRAVSDELKRLEPELARIEEEVQTEAARLPNLPDPKAPDGASDDDNVEIRRWGQPTHFDFGPKDHVELGQSLGMIDIERGVRTSGSRFYYLTGPAVRLEFALLQYGLDFAESRGMQPMWTPALVRREAMYGTGFLPTDEAQIYQTRDDELYLVGTAEVPLASYHAGEILDPDQLPRRYLGYSTCFRREAGTYGKDTHGIFRVHQFDKLEMFSFVHPDESAAEHERLLALEEEWVRSLELPYRVVDVCIGELGASAARKFDIEAWFPGQGKYREITSTSNTTDYQARRLEVRVRESSGNRPVHTVNGTLSAMTRTIIALMENGQRGDGSVELPSALRPYVPEKDWVIRPTA